jgi:cyclohexyl-isocyanide hydratase
VSSTVRIGLLLFPGVTQLDLTGPYEILRRVPGAEVHLVWKTLDAVVCDGGMRILPSMPLEQCPPLDVVLVPGGPGQVDLMADAAVLEWVAAQGARARYVASVCTGSLVLAVAGLLSGYRATCHWMSLDLLRHWGAVPTAERVVVDRNRITGAGVTAGIDMALALAALLAGQEEARLIALQVEAVPVSDADPETILEAQRRGKELQKRRRAAVICSGSNGTHNL